MASIKEISLPHGTIPTQMFGNVNLQNAMMYVNENFAEVKSGVNDAVAAANDALDAKADADHDHDETYAALEHTHAQSEITGLQSALDDKASLNHEHSQYLTSLPAHYHATSDVQGLDNLLQAKAEKVHTHTIADVENLTTQLDVKASTAYVDQQISSVSNSIKTIADNEVEGYATDKTNVANTPLDVDIAPDNETEDQKKARIGTSTNFARKDHKHVIGVGTAPTSRKVIGFEANSATASLLDAATVDTEATASTTGTLMTWDSTNGKFVKDGNSYSKFSTTPVGSKLVKTIGTDGTVAEVSIGAGLEIDSTNGLELSDVMTAAQATNVSDGKSVVTASSALKLMKADEIYNSQGDVEGYTLSYRQPIVDQYGRLEGLSDWVELCKVFAWSQI